MCVYGHHHYFGCDSQINTHTHTFSSYNISIVVTIIIIIISEIGNSIEFSNVLVISINGSINGTTNTHTPITIIISYNAIYSLLIQFTRTLKLFHSLMMMMMMIVGGWLNHMNQLVMVMNDTPFLISLCFFSKFFFIFHQSNQIKWMEWNASHSLFLFYQLWLIWPFFLVIVHLIRINFSFFHI